MSGPNSVITIPLPYEPPLDWSFLLGFLRERQTAGVEWIGESVYVRTAAVDGDAGLIAVIDEPGKARLLLSIAGPLAHHKATVARRVARMFDLDLEQSRVQLVLDGDPIIGPLRRAHPGIRIPGAWSPFEALLRTIVGQQVSVAAATTVAGRIVERTGQALPDGLAESLDSFEFPPDALVRLFPDPAVVARANLEGIGMPGRRVATLQETARLLAEGKLVLPKAEGGGPSVEEVKTSLVQLPGIGPWTARLFALRALGYRDAWPDTDLILRRQLEERIRERLLSEGKGIEPAQIRRAVQAMSEGWRPYRAYAALQLWHAASLPKKSS